MAQFTCHSCIVPGCFSELGKTLYSSVLFLCVNCMLKVLLAVIEMDAAFLSIDFSGNCVKLPLNIYEIPTCDVFLKWKCRFLIRVLWQGEDSVANSGFVCAY